MPKGLGKSELMHDDACAGIEWVDKYFACGKRRPQNDACSVP